MFAWLRRRLNPRLTGQQALQRRRVNSAPEGDLTASLGPRHPPDPPAPATISRRCAPSTGLPPVPTGTVSVVARRASSPSLRSETHICTQVRFRPTDRVEIAHAHA